MLKKVMALATLATAACTTTEHQAPTAQDVMSPETIQVMIVGSSHLAGSTLDVANSEGVNVFTPKRQRELEQVAKAINAFAPTAVALERITAAPDYVDPNYADYTAAMLAEKADERVQIAYRIADLAGITRVYGIDEQPEGDEPDYFPFGALMAHAEATGQKEKIEAQIAAVQVMIATSDERHAAMNMAEMLIDINVGEISSPDFYYQMFEYDRGEAQPGSELQSYWFMRNAKIFSKLLQVAEPGDRIVVVYGAGHKFWLDHFAENTPGVAKVDVAPFLLCAIDATC